MKKEKIINWLDELADENPNNFHEYFYDDVRNFVIDQESESEKMKILFQCKNKEEIKRWLNEVSGYIVMKLDTDLLLSNYFYSE
jgi:hypothetical protein